MNNNRRLIQLLVNENPALQSLLDSGTITEEAVVDNYYMGKFDELTTIHKRAIRKRIIAKTGQQQWVTTVYKTETDKTGKSVNKRCDITASTERNLKIKLLDFYGLNIDNRMTMQDAYNAYAEKHAMIVSSDNSRLRAEQIYHKYLADTDMMSQPVCCVKKPQLELFCNKLIKERAVTYENWQNIKAVLNGIYNAALDAEEITINPLTRIQLTAKFKQSRKKAKEDLYFNRVQLEHFRSWVMKEYQETQNIACIAVLFQVVTGMRVGEVGALRWSDILPEEIAVERELVCDKRKGTYHIVEHTKGYEKRFIPRHPLTVTYLNMIKARPIISAELVFTQPDGDYVTTRAINHVLEKYAAHNGLTPKRSHCLRRTYATLLYLAGESEETIKEYLGHSDILTTRRYICAQRNAAQSVSRLAEAM